MKTPIITAFDYNELRAGAIIRHNDCQVAVYGDELVMRRGEGTQKLKINDTDRDTLNGAWLEFTK